MVLLFWNQESECDNEGRQQSTITYYAHKYSIFVARELLKETHMFPSHKKIIGPLKSTPLYYQRPFTRHCVDLSIAFHY